MISVKLVPQSDSLKVKSINLLEACFDKQRNEIGGVHGPLFPDHIRGLICGPSGSGKTNLLFTLLTEKNGLRYSNIYIVSKSLEQIKYKLLKEIFQKVRGLTSNFLSDCNDLPTVEDCKPNTVIIIDDVLCIKDDKNKLRSYFCFGRHKNISPIYLYQTYTHIEKHLFRDNANFIILFRQDDTNLQHVYKDHISNICTFDQFKKLCEMCWQDRYGFITISKEKDINNGKLCKGLDQYIILESR